MIPEFLNKANKEFIVIDGELFQVKVEFVPFCLVDDESRLEMQLLLSRDTIANASLNILNIIGEKRLEKFISCRFGGFDNKPDVDQEKNTTPEYLECPSRGSCPVEGKLCKHIKVMNGYLTPREITIIKLISRDLADKEIADRLGISVNTMAKHRVNIEHKINANSKVGIATFAVQKNIT
jgi:DNA-binding CsgD family transcriptional regulator